mgnify:CR=1 FL=1
MNVRVLSFSAGEGALPDDVVRRDDQGVEHQVGDLRRDHQGALRRSQLVRPSCAPLAPPLRPSCALLAPPLRPPEPP